MNWFTLALGTLIVLLAVKPSVLKARKQLRDTKLDILELKRRKQSLSLKLRLLARESLGQRLTTGADTNESEELGSRIATLKQRVTELEAVDRRILVLDERRGLQESGWIVLIRRARAKAQPMEPTGITRLWDEGRYVFVFAADARKARRKTLVRFPEDAGFQILEIYAHEGDMSETPQVTDAAAMG